MRLVAFLFLTLTLPHFVSAQIDTAPIEGLRQNTPRLHVLRGATIWTKPGEKIENGTVILRDGVIENIGGADLEVPANARDWDFSGKVIYAGFIDAAAALGTPNAISKTNTSWNSLVRPERRTVEFGKPSNEDIAELRGLGFTTAHVIPAKGIFRGQSSAINLSDDYAVVVAELRQCLAFEKNEKVIPTP